MADLEQRVAALEQWRHNLAADRPANPEYLRTSEAARRLGVSPSTIDRMLRTGRLPYTQFRPGGDRLIPVDAVEQLAANPTTGDADDA